MIPTPKNAGFTYKSYLKASLNAGFGAIYSGVGAFEIVAFGFKGVVGKDLHDLFNLSKN